MQRKILITIWKPAVSSGVKLCILIFYSLKINLFLLPLLYKRPCSSCVRKMSPWLFSVPAVALENILKARAHGVASFLYANSLYNLKCYSSTVSNVLEIIGRICGRRYSSAWTVVLESDLLGIGHDDNSGIENVNLNSLFLFCISKVHFQNYYCS